MAEEVQYTDDTYTYQEYTGNGEPAVEQAEEQLVYQYTEFYSTLQGQGIGDKLAGRIDQLVQEAILTAEELDDRALEALKEFNEEDGLQVIEQFAKSDLSHVQNKSAFLCGVMKTYRAKMKLKEQQGENAPSSGPDEDKIKALLERSGYTLDITTGQRKYGGPPPGWEGLPPGQGEKKFCSQVFIGKLPRDLFEDELIPVFEQYGQIYDFRLMIDSMSGQNKGYAFCTYFTKEQAQASVKGLDKHEIRSGKKLGVCLSLPNDRLFVGSIPKTKTKEQIMDEFGKITENLTDVIIYVSPEDKKKNRGFAFLQYESHKAASLARRRLMSGKIRVFGHIQPTVDWADPQEEPDDEVMQRVKVVYVRNLTPNIDEDKLTELFKQYGEVEKVKKIKDYAFIHFKERDCAVRAIEELDGQTLDDLKIEVALAKPQSEKKERRRGQSGFGALNAPGEGRGGMRGNFRGGPGNRGGFNDGYGGGYGGGGGGSYGGGGYGGGSYGGGGRY